jgi:hypothetical protein
MRPICVALLLLLFVVGCDNPGGSSAGFAKDYERQVKEYDAQTKKVAEQAARFDKLLERWENQADRYDSLLEKWEKQATKSK